MAERVPEPVSETERWLRRRFHNSSAFLSLDAADRWEPKDEDSLRRLREDEAKLTEERATIDAGLTAAIAELRASAPGLVARWADAHIALLTHLVASLADDERSGTEKYVAIQEREGWEKVRAGELRWVEQNPYYVRYDPGLYAALFGYGRSVHRPSVVRPGHG